MACTTILVGKKASYDGSTMIARNDDSGSGHFTPKKFVVVQPQEQPRHYESVISHVKIELPEQPMRYTAVPNAVDGEGIWAASGVNEAHVAMTATETPRIRACSAQIRWWYTRRQRMVSRRYVEGSARKILCVLYFRISAAPERVSDVWEACWSSTAPMR